MLKAALRLENGCSELQGKDTMLVLEQMGGKRRQRQKLQAWCSNASLSCNV